MKTTNIRRAKGFSTIFFMLLLMAMTLSLSQPVYADSITVTTTDDVLDADAVVDPTDCTPLTISNLNSSPGADGLISLREAICAANNTAGDDDISLPAGTYTLSLTGMSENLNVTGDLDITSNITITGQDDDARNTIIQAGTDETNGIDRVFHILTGATATMEKITVRHGRISSHGAGIYVQDGNLTIINSNITNNNIIAPLSSRYGGGIRVYDGALTLNNSTVSYNTAGANGGGIQFRTGTLTINSSTISNNIISSGSGGGLYIDGGTGKINNSTIASNTSSGSGGGIYVIAGTSQIKNTIIANNNSTTNNNHDCYVSGTALTSAGYNLIRVTNSCFTADASDVTGSDPNLAALANNGGPTDTHAIQDDMSPAVDVGDPTNCQDIDNSTVSEDQRGTTRSYDGNGDMTTRCDIGAYEFGAPTVVSLANFSALAGRDHVQVTWDTVFESDNLGFDVYRSTTDERPNTSLNEVMISSQTPGSGQGSSYAYEDYDLVAGTTYYYWLADVNLNHVETYHGPVTVVYDYIPTAITIRTLDSNSNSVPLAGLAALLGVALMAGGMLRRRD